MTDPTYDTESLHTAESRERDARFVGHEPKGSKMTDRVDRERLESHIEWLDGNHDRCNPFLAKDIRALLAERDALDHELSRFRQDRSYVIGFNDGWESALAEQEKKDD